MSFTVPILKEVNRLTASLVYRRGGATMLELFGFFLLLIGLYISWKLLGLLLKLVLLPVKLALVFLKLVLVVVGTLVLLSLGLPLLVALSLPLLVVGLLLWGIARLLLA